MKATNPVRRINTREFGDDRGTTKEVQCVGCKKWVDPARISEQTVMHTLGFPCVIGVCVHCD